MERRLKLHNELGSIEGVVKVYYNPPESIKLEYDCIVYEYDGDNSSYANNTRYISSDRYSVTVISRDPDNTIGKQLMAKFRYCSFSRRFVSDNLYHDVYTLHY